MAGERAKVLDVACEDGAGGFSDGDDDGVDGRALPGEGTEGTGSAGDPLRDSFEDVTDLEEAVDVCVDPLAPGERLGEHNRGDDRRP